MYMGLHAMAARMHTSRTTPGGDRGGGGTTRASPDATDKRARTDSRIPEAQRRSLRTQSPESPAITARSQLSVWRCVAFAHTCGALALSREAR